MADPLPIPSADVLSLAAEAAAGQAIACCIMIELMNCGLLDQAGATRIFDNAELVMAANATTGRGHEADTIYSATLLNAIKGMRRGMLQPVIKSEG